MKYKKTVIGLMVALVAVIGVYVGTNIAFKSALRSNCPAELNCDCFVGVISHNISFIGKLQIMLSDTPPMSVLNDIPIVSLIGCAMLSE